ncbi:MAG: hemin uptake protein HemP [Planctomycetaceae bacterium]
MSASHPENRPEREDPLRSAVPQAPRVIRFEEVSGGLPEIQLEFRGQIYRLRVTKNGKLILNK